MNSVTRAPLPAPPAGRTGWPWTGVSPAPEHGGKAWPRVTLVTPSYNQGRYIEETIRSVLGQNYPNLEYIILDGGSSDETLETIRRFAPWLSHWESGKDQGQADAINRGWASATGEYLWWLNSDDLLCPGSLTATVEFLEANPQIGLAHGDLIHIDESGHQLGSERRHELDLTRLVAHTEWIAQPGALMRRAVLERVGALDVSMHFLMDFDYSIRAALEFPFGHVRQPLAAFRHHASQKTSSRSAIAAEEILRVYGKLYDRQDLPAELRRVQTQAWASAHRYAASARHFDNDPPGAWMQMKEALRLRPAIALEPATLSLLARLLAARALPSGRESSLFRLLRGLRHRTRRP